MNKNSLLVVTIISFAVMIGCGRSDKGEAAAKPTDADSTEARFIQQVSQSCTMSIQIAKQGISKASLSEVKALCEKIETDQKELWTDVKDLASEKNVTLSDTLGSKRARRLTALDSAKAEPELDKKIISMLGAEIRTQQRAFNRLAASKDPEIRKFIQENENSLNANLDSTRSLRRKAFPPTSARAVRKKPVRTN